MPEQPQGERTDRQHANQSQANASQRTNQIQPVAENEPGEHNQQKLFPCRQARQPVAADQIKKCRGMDFNAGSQPATPPGVRSAEQITQLSLAKDGRLTANEDNFVVEITVRLFPGGIIT